MVTFQYLLGRKLQYRGIIGLWKYLTQMIIEFLIGKKP